MECKGMERERTIPALNFIFQLLLDENTRSQLFCLYITNLTMTVCGGDLLFCVTFCSHFGEEKECGFCL